MSLKSKFLRFLKNFKNLKFGLLRFLGFLFEKSLKNLGFLRPISTALIATNGILVDLCG